MKQKLWSSRPCICTSATTFFFTWGGGGGGRAINRQTAIFVAASPRLKKIQYRHSPSHGSAGSSGGHGRWFPWPRPGSFSQNPSTPPKINSMEHQEPSGARHTRTQQSTGQDRLYRTTNPQEQEALLGRARLPRSLQGMTWSQGPSPGCLRNRF